MAMPNWEKVEVPEGGNFIGFGNKAGQAVIGKVLDFGLTSGSDFNGDPCPQLSLELIEDASSFDKALNETTYSAGELVTITAGLVRLGRALRKADPQPGDLIKIVMTGLVDIGNGKSMKDFEVFTAHGAGKSVRAVKDDSGPDF